MMNLHASNGRLAASLLGVLVATAWSVTSTVTSCHAQAGGVPTDPSAGRAASATTTAERTDRWPMSRCDLLNSGQSPGGKDAEVGQEKWKFLAGGAITATAIAWDGVVYFGDHASNFFAVDAKTGKRRWQSVPNGLASRPTSGYRFSAPVIADAAVVAATQDGTITAFARSDGSVIWEKVLPKDVYSSLRFAAGKVLIGCTDNYFYALDVLNGDTVWSYECGDIVGSSAVILASSGRVIFPSHDKFLHIVDLETGKSRTKWDIGYRSTGQPAMAFGCLYMCTTGRKFMCLDLMDGSVRWTQQSLQETQHGIGVWKDRVYVHLSRYLQCFDANSGKELWSQELTSNGSVSPCTGAKLVYISDVKGGVFALDAETGKPKWTARVGDGSFCSPILVDGVLYVGDGQGYMTAFE